MPLFRKNLNKLLAERKKKIKQGKAQIKSAEPYYAEARAMEEKGLRLTLDSAHRLIDRQNRAATVHGAGIDKMNEGYALTPKINSIRKLRKSPPIGFVRKVASSGAAVGRDLKRSVTKM